MMATAFDQSVLSPLRRLGRRLRVYLLIEGLAATAMAVVVLAGLQFALDFLLSLDRLPRAVLLLAMLGGIVMRIWRRLIAPQRLVVEPQRLAAALERRHPALQDRLISAVQFATGAGMPAGARVPDTSAAMVRTVIEQATAEFARLRPGELLRTRSVRNSAMTLAAAALVAVGVIFARSDLLHVYVSRNLLLADVPWPAQYRLTLENARNGLIRWPRGDILALMLALEGRAPRAMTMQFEADGGAAGERPLSRLGESRFRCDFGPLEDAMRVRFLSARWGTYERSDWYRIEAVDRPSVKATTVHIEPPAYTRQKAYTFPAGQVSGDVPAGSRVVFEVRLNKPVVSARLRDAAHNLGPAERISPTQWRARVEPVRSGGYSFELKDDMGLEDTRPVSFSLRLVTDRPPSVRLTLPGVGGMILPEAVLPMRFEFEENWGLATAEMEYQIDRSGVSSQPAPVVEAIPGFETYQTRFTHQRSWNLAPLKLVPADRLIVSGRSRDFKDFGDPNLGRSVVHNLRVVTREELLGELARRENEWRQEFEQIVKTQESFSPRLAALRVDPPPSDRSLRYSSEERTERQVAARLRRVRGQFEQILSEMEINGLATPAVQLRLGTNVIQPLGELTTGDTPAAADLMARLGRAYSDADAGALDAAQVRIVRAMNAVLANMLKWEGFNEATALLRDILKMQGDVNRQTKEELERQIEQLFGPQEQNRPRQQ